MKKILGLSTIILLTLTGCTVSIGTDTTPTNPSNESPTPPPSAITQTTENSCPTGQYSCACATGNYCLKMGAMCLNPSSACPNTNADNGSTQQNDSQSTSNGSTQTYNNSAYNFTFDYPTEFSFVDPNYANLDQKIVQIQLASKDYPKTNLGDAAFTVSEATTKTEKECLTLNLPEGSDGFKDTKTINGVNFFTTTGAGAGAGNLYDMKTYRTFVSPTCYELNETIHTAQIGNFDPGTVTEVNKDEIWAKLEGILATFKFTA